ncbi:hypothetical protein [Sphingobacterium mizutaii]|uniref:hypothetical protein n=1 Tax=Sphingobacterium mizutaii TaxID=1010 RepID=UPI0028A9266E|nr:hypothetical protein [Sphingobacterium mizutaii]
MVIISNKEDLIELMERVFEKYEKESGDILIRNTNRENYGKLARVLSDISRQLPYTSADLAHDPYEEDAQPNLDYPNRKYDITGGQLKDAYFGIVSNPRPYLIDACLIYLTGKGSRANHDKEFATPLWRKSLLYGNLVLKPKVLILLLLTSLILILLLGLIILRLNRKEKGIEVAYSPSASEIKALSGIWLYYTGAPQARSNEPNRFRQFVNNIVEIKYHKGKFEFIRHGANINHYGYMVYNSPAIVSIHSYVSRKKNGEVLSPSHSLGRLDTLKKRMVALSTTWSFESDNRDEIIAIRNLYHKVADAGSLNQIINTQENAACNCKIIEWRHGNSTKQYKLQYKHLDKDENEELKSHLNEESILLLNPRKDVVLLE